jgi:hypothetical protein
MTFDQDALRLSIKLPKQGREFVLGVAVFAMVMIGFGLAALFFEQLGERPLGGLLDVGNLKALAPLAGAVAALAVAGVRLVWRKHESFVARGNSEIKDALAGFREEISVRLETVEHQVSVTNGSVAEAIRQGLENKHEIEKVKAYTRGKAGLPMED